MIVIVALTALAALSWLLFHLAALALPLAVGIAAASLAHQTGAGLIGSGATGFLAGVLTLALGQFLFSATRTPAPRLLLALVFATPASIAGYAMTSGIMESGGAAGAWGVIFGLIGASITGVAAVARVGGPAWVAPVDAPTVSGLDHLGPADASSIGSTSHAPYAGSPRPRRRSAGRRVQRMRPTSF